MNSEIDELVALLREQNIKQAMSFMNEAEHTSRLFRVAASAIHEAGHAVCAIACDVHVELVRINRAGVGGNAMHSKSERFEKPLSDEDRRRAFNVAMVYAAGPIAQETYTCKNVVMHGLSDFYYSTSLANLLFEQDTVGALEWLLRVFATARIIVDNRKHEVLRVARELIEEGELSGEVVRATIALANF